MKKILLVTTLLFSTLAMADCVYNTYQANGRIVTCQTCCYGNSCNTTCY